MERIKPVKINKSKKNKKELFLGFEETQSLFNLIGKEKWVYE